MKKILLITSLMLGLISCRKSVEITPPKCLQISLIIKDSSGESSFYYEYDSKDRRTKRIYLDALYGFVDTYQYGVSTITRTNITTNKTPVTTVSVFNLNTDGTVSNIVRSDGNNTTFKYDSNGYLLESRASNGDITQYIYKDENLVSEVILHSNGKTDSYTFEHYLDKIDKHTVDYSIYYGLYGKGSKNIVKSYTYTNTQGKIVKVDESYLFDDNGNITQITDVGTDPGFSGVYKYAYQCK